MKKSVYINCATFFFKFYFKNEKKFLISFLGFALTLTLSTEKAFADTDGKASPNINSGPCCETGVGSCGPTVEL
ncbi:hypothetical protein [Tenacibaculum sp. UWU-22]|uniref:hypothetical protein n=1 Tax=Tenacibaculum sp. UWU-22 TaxID=3234187 RepID=UPI0034DB75A2